MFAAVVPRVGHLSQCLDTVATTLWHVLRGWVARPWQARDQALGPRISPT